MVKAFSGWLRRLLAVVRKDLLEEFRSKYVFGTLFLFALAVLIMISFSVGVYAISNHIHAVFIWIILFFSAMTGMDRSFVKEEEKKTAMALRLSAPPGIIYFGKLCFNFITLVSLMILVLFFYLFFMNLTIGNMFLLISTLFAGVFCLTGTTTVLSAIVAKAGSKNALLPVLAFPLLLPVLVVAVRATNLALDGTSLIEGRSELQFMFSYGVIVITASQLLFSYVWEE